MIKIQGKDGALVFHVLMLVVVWVAADTKAQSVGVVQRAASETYRVVGPGRLTLHLSNGKLPGAWSLAERSEAVGGVFSFSTLEGQLEFERSGGDLRLLPGGHLATEDSLLSLISAADESVGLGGLVLSSHFGNWTLSATGEALRSRPVFRLIPETIVVDAASDSRLQVRAELTLSESIIRELGIPAEASSQKVAVLTLAIPVARSTRRSPVNVQDGSSGHPAAAGAIGPDVVVSSLGTTLAEDGMVGNIAAYAMDTTSCNRGDAEAIWIECISGLNCNQHPVISQNLYRLGTKAGTTRFEQIGMAWLKHGFCAADSVLCGACQNAGTCDFLGVNCSDTYSSFLNGRQQGMGPRSEVNAYTGEYPYPYIRAWQQTGDAIFKRLQVHNVDLDPAMNPGAMYFGEAHYVNTDEQPAARFNNVSWRQVVVGSFSPGIGWNLSFTGSTRESQAAIEAWPQFDPGAVVVDAFVPNEGRFILGYKVTGLGGNMWHYEYALYNMNSDRSAQSFSVPIPSGVGVANIGFHDVDYHSGEPYSGTDWPGVHAGAAVTWETETFAANINANALRWDTTYNFRFDCDSPPTTPATVDVTVGLFKPGTPASLAVPAIGPQPVPPGCDCNSDPGCEDGNPCTIDQCINCLCSQTTVPYGDVDHNGTVNIFDIFCVLQGFAGNFDICSFADDDIEPCGGDTDIDIFDLFAVLNSFAGLDPCCSGP